MFVVSVQWSSSSPGCLGKAALLYCGNPCAFHIIILKASRMLKSNRYVIYLGSDKISANQNHITEHLTLAFGSTLKTAAHGRSFFILFQIFIVSQCHTFELKIAYLPGHENALQVSTSSGLPGHSSPP